MHVNPPRMSSLFGRFGAVIAMALLIGGATFAGTAHAKPMSEKEKIDALIHVVETRDDLQFIRLGEAHSASEAARVLRTKLWYAGSRVKTADEFIEHIASATLGGSPYFVRYRDGKQVASGEFLRAELKRINQASASN